MLYFWQAYENTIPAMYIFALSSFCGSPAMKSSMLRCRDNLNLTFPPPPSPPTENLCS